MKKKYTQAEMARNWRKSLKDELDSLSSLELQKKAWIDRTDPNLWWEWVEVVCGYFDDLLLNEKPEWPNEGLTWHVKEKRLTQDEANILKPFNEAFSRYADKSQDYPSIEAYQKILADPEWIKITEMAKGILNKIDFDKLP